MLPIMDLAIDQDLATILSPYQKNGWHFRYAKSINNSFHNMVVLYFTIPNQPPRFERFQQNDPHILQKIANFLATTQVLAH